MEGFEPDLFAAVVVQPDNVDASTKCSICGAVMSAADLMVAHREHLMKVCEQEGLRGLMWLTVTVIAFFFKYSASIPQCGKLACGISCDDDATLPADSHVPGPTSIPIPSGTGKGEQQAGSGHFDQEE